MSKKMLASKLLARSTAPESNFFLLPQFFARLDFARSASPARLLNRLELKWLYDVHKFLPLSKTYLLDIE